jgi:hypothetical protein
MTQLNTDFIEQGLANYCEARRAIDQFETQVQNAASAALSRQLTALAEAIGKPFSGNQTTRYLNADAPDFSWAWVAVWLACERPLSWLYVGIRWELNSGGAQKVYAAVDFDAANAPARDRLLTAAAKVVPPPRFDLENPYRNETLMRVELKQGDAASLESVLSEMLSEWERLFHAIGGAATLDPTP